MERFVILMAVVLIIQVVWGVTLRRSVCNSWCSEGS